eukprot:scaffold8972_cov118-Isochrysis_galbana.AAC.14
MCGFCWRLLHCAGAAVCGCFAFDRRPKLPFRARPPTLCNSASSDRMDRRVAEPAARTAARRVGVSTPTRRAAWHLSASHGSIAVADGCIAPVAHTPPTVAPPCARNRLFAPTPSSRRVISGRRAERLRCSGGCGGDRGAPLAHLLPDPRPHARAVLPVHGQRRRVEGRCHSRDERVGERRQDVTRAGAQEIVGGIRKAGGLAGGDGGGPGVEAYRRVEHSVAGTGGGKALSGECDERLGGRGGRVAGQGRFRDGARYCGGCALGTGERGANALAWRYRWGAQIEERGERVAKGVRWVVVVKPTEGFGRAAREVGAGADEAWERHLWRMEPGGWGSGQPVSGGAAAVVALAVAQAAVMAWAAEAATSRGAGDTRR